MKVWLFGGLVALLVLESTCSPVVSPKDYMRPQNRKSWSGSSEVRLQRRPPGDDDDPDKKGVLLQAPDTGPLGDDDDPNKKGVLLQAPDTGPPVDDDDDDPDKKGVLLQAPPDTGTVYWLPVEWTPWNHWMPWINWSPWTPYYGGWLSWSPSIPWSTNNWNTNFGHKRKRTVPGHIEADNEQDLTDEGKDHRRPRWAGWSPWSSWTGWSPWSSWTGWSPWSSWSFWGSWYPFKSWGNTHGWQRKRRAAEENGQPPEKDLNDEDKGHRRSWWTS